ncbi:MAG: DsrE family protein [Thermodesulfovibrionales bacterium]
MVTKDEEKLFVVLCSAGFDNILRMRSALMYATLAAHSDYRSVLYCVQDAVDIMVQEEIEKNETPSPGSPTLTQRLHEALDSGVEILCCSQTLANKKIGGEQLAEGIKIAGAMTLISLTTSAKGTLCF